MKIAIITDTHDHHANVLKAVELFNAESVDYILHAGDIVSPFTARAFAAVKDAEFIAVFGNNDGEKMMLKSVIAEFGGNIHQDPYHGEIAGKKIFLTHKPGLVDDIVAAGKYDLVAYGHTHKRDIRRVGKTLIVNPGEATDWISGAGNVVIVDTETMSVEEYGL